MKNVDDLIKPRYEVIADYPCSDFEVGDIIQFVRRGKHKDIFWVDKASRSIGLEKGWFDKYPHLFQKLSWWEHLEESEMPEYLSHTIQGKTTYHKIIRWDMGNPNYIIGLEDEKNGCNLGIWAKQYTYQPATEQDYLNYLKNNKTPY